MSKKKENAENLPPMHLLLPKCIELDTDVFDKILSSVVYHIGLHDVHAIISGMKGETFEVDGDDLSLDWKTLNTSSRQIRQGKLLGFWAARHFPLIGKKLIGEAYEPPGKCNVKVSEPIEISAKELDNIVSKKMKLRIIEVNACQSDSSKLLKWFVPVPMSIVRVNATQLSPKMRAFDIQTEYLTDCWKALEIGGFPFEQQMVPSATFKVPQPSVVKTHSAIVHRNYDQSTVKKRNPCPKRFSDVMLSSSSSVDISANTTRNGVVSEKRDIPTAKRARCESSSNSTTGIMHDGTNLDILRVDVIQMRNDIQSLIVSQNVTAEKNEKLEKEMTTIKSRLAHFDSKSGTNPVLDVAVNNHFTHTESNLRCEIRDLEQKLSVANLINIELTDTNGKLQKKLDAANNHFTDTESSLQYQIQDLVQKLSDADEINIELTKKKADPEPNLQFQIQDLVHKLSAADRLNIELTDTNGNLKQTLDATKNQFTYTESNLQCHIQDLVHKLSAADRMNIELTKTSADTESNHQCQIQDLVHKLSAADRMNIELTKTSADTESNLQCHIQDLVHKLSAADRMNIELTDTNSKLRLELEAANNHFIDMESNLQWQIQDLVSKLSAADGMNIEVTDTNDKLKQELDAAKNHFTATESNLQCNIRDLEQRLAAADRMNIEFTGTNGKLQQELYEARAELKKNEKLIDLEARANNLMTEFRSRLDETAKMNDQLADENYKLRKELHDLKQNDSKDKEGEKVLDVHIGFGQVDLEEKNVQCIAVLGANCEEKLFESIDRASNEDHSIKLHEDLQTNKANNELPLEPVKSGECVTAETCGGGALNQTIFWTEGFTSTDEIVRRCRPILMEQKFDWVKFQQFKKAKFYPAFIYPPDKDGFERAQKITANGYITDSKTRFWNFSLSQELPDEHKESAQLLTLKKFNIKFGASFE